MQKVKILCLIPLCMALLLCGRTPNVPQETNGSIVPPSSDEPTGTINDNLQPVQSNAVAILEQIWEQFSQEERFACYGGSIEHAVNDAPGSLELDNIEELASKYLFPGAMLQDVKEAASLVHMMNSNIFTAMVVRLSSDGDMEMLYKQWRDAIQNNRWICGQPDRLILAQIDGDSLLMSFGSKDIMTQLQQKLAAAYPNAAVLYNEAIVS
jgi:hypothetical protein